MIDSLRLAHEHNFELLTVWVVIDVLRKFLISRISLHRNVNGYAGFQIDDILLERVDLVIAILDLVFSILQLLQHVKLRGLRVVEFLFELNDVRRCTLKLFLEFSLGSLQRDMVLRFHFELLFDIFFLSKMRPQLKIFRSLVGVLSLEILILDIHLVKTELIGRSHLLDFNGHVLDNGIFLKSHRFVFSVLFLEIEFVPIVDRLQHFFKLQSLLYVLVPQLLCLFQVLPFFFDEKVLEFFQISVKLVFSLLKSLEIPIV